MAKKQKNTEPEAVEKPKPTLYLDDDDYIDGLSVGDEIARMIKLKMTGQSINEYDGKKTKSQTFEILGIDKPKNIDTNKFARAAQRSGGFDE